MLGSEKVVSRLDRVENKPRDENDYNRKAQYAQDLLRILLAGHYSEGTVEDTPNLGILGIKVCAGVPFYETTHAYAL